jgi:hypothetical protein
MSICYAFISFRRTSRFVGNWSAGLVAGKRSGPSTWQFCTPAQTWEGCRECRAELAIHIQVFTLHDAYSRSATAPSIPIPMRYFFLISCRFVYYTLLKLDVLQGEKFALDLDKCINLGPSLLARPIYYTRLSLFPSFTSAAYQLQIEFPDFKPTLQQLKMLNLLPTVNVFKLLLMSDKKSSLLPQSMCRNPKINTDDTYLRILTAFEKLHTMEPAYASLLYIVDVQQCVGYGEEAFTCKAC